MLVDLIEPQELMKLIGREKITFAPFNRHLSRHMVLNMPADPVDFSHLHLAFIGAKTLSHQILTSLKERYNISLSVGFGLGDVVPLTITMFQASSDELRSHGQPLLGTEIEVRNKAGQRTAPYHSGQIYARGPQINLDWDPGSNDGRATSGWIDTGHAGYINEAGNLFLTENFPKQPVVQREFEKDSSRVPDFLRPKTWAASVYGR